MNESPVRFSITQISFSKNVTLNLRQEIANHLRVQEVDRQEKYLGLPSIVGRSTKAIFSCIKERIWKKLQLNINPHYYYVGSLDAWQHHPRADIILGS